MATKTYFWKPRGEAYVEKLNGANVELKIKLVDYGGSDEPYDIDKFNDLKFFALQCIEEWWSNAVYFSKIKRIDAAVESKLEKNPAKKLVDKLNKLKSAHDFNPRKKQWQEFGDYAEEYIVSVEKNKKGKLTRFLSFEVADENLLEPMQYMDALTLG